MKIPGHPLLSLFSDRDENIHSDTNKILKWLEPITLTAVNEFIDHPTGSEHIVWVDAMLSNDHVTIVGAVMSESEKLQESTDSIRPLVVNVPLNLAFHGSTSDVVEYLKDMQANNNIVASKTETVDKEITNSGSDDQFKLIVDDIISTVLNKHSFDTSVLDDDTIKNMESNKSISKGKLH